MRFFNDKAYIVTYQRTDPLYVIDLSNDNDPQIVGALEIPGYSSYLHPINQNLLLGVGQQIDPAQLPIQGQSNSSESVPIIEGAKVALFDVSNPAAPQEVGSVVWESGYTPVEWDHHALSYLPVSDIEHRFALPLSSWSTGENDQWFAENSLQMLQVNISANGAELIKNNPINVPTTTDSQVYIGASDDRSILHDQQVYYIHGNSVFHAQWGQ